MSVITDLLRELKPEDESFKATSGIIRSINNTNKTVGIEFRPTENALLNIPVVYGYTPVLGDPVIVAKNGPRWCVLGPLSTYKKSFENAPDLSAYMPKSGGTWTGNTSLNDKKMYLRGMGDENHFIVQENNVGRVRSYFGIDLESALIGPIASFRDTGVTMHRGINMQSNGLSSNGPDTRHTFRSDNGFQEWYRGVPLLIENATGPARIGFHQPGKVGSSFGQALGQEHFRTYSGGGGDGYRGLWAEWFAKDGKSGYEGQGYLCSQDWLNQDCLCVYHGSDYRYLANRHSGFYNVAPGSFGMPDGNWWTVLVIRHPNQGNNHGTMVARRWEAFGEYVNLFKSGNGTDAGCVNGSVVHTGWNYVGS